MERKRKKRYYHILDILVLACLALLLYTTNFNYRTSVHQRAIELFWFDWKFIKKYPDIFRGPYPPKRYYIDINLTGEKKSDKTKLDFSQIRLREILSRNDSVYGIHYYFDDSSEYGSFIKALDICRIEQAKTYMPYENHLWVYYTTR